MASLNATLSAVNHVFGNDALSTSALDEVRSLRDATLAKHGITLGSIIGEGGQGCVFRATSRQGDVAVKILRKLSGRNGVAQRVQVKAEVKILCEVVHEHVLRLKQWFEDKRHYYMITELVDGQDLFDVACSHVFTENQILVICSDIVEALKNMHARGIAHRDIKLENVLLANSSLHAILIDFGFAVKVSMDTESKTGLTGFPGTLNYQAPEIVRRDATYDPFRADMYALGVMVYILICGSYPFNGQTKEQLMGAICREQVRFGQPVWRRVTPQAKMLIKALLSPNPEQRPTAEQLGSAFDQLFMERTLDMKPQAFEPEVPRALYSVGDGASRFEHLDFATNAKKLALLAQDVKHNCASPKLTVSPRLLGLFGMHGQHPIT